MKTAIGSVLKDNKVGMYIALVLAVVIVGSDLIASALGAQNVLSRFVISLAILLIYGSLSKWNLRSMGLVVRPVQGYGYWVKVTLAVGIIVAALVCLFLVFWGMNERQMRLYSIRPSQFGGLFLEMCLLAPVLEEMIYRFALCIPASAFLGPWSSIVISGCVFALLHVVYGNPGPDNLVAGFFLAWVYLKSGSLLLPIILHSVGNLCVLLGWLGCWVLTVS